MQNSLIYRGVYFLIAILFSGCFTSAPTPSSDISQYESSNIVSASAYEVIDSILSLRISSIEEELIFLQNYSDDNSRKIKSIKDSLKTFYQLNISGDTSDKDIINSLIRIQSKLNIIEEKIFYSDSIYFNLLNDLVLIENQIESLDKNIESIIDLDRDMINKRNETEGNPKKELSFKDNYEIAREYYLKKNYKESLNIFRYLIELDKYNPLSDNCQFWIGEIYYIDQLYETAISEYSRVSGLGDNNKTPYADYKMALCYVNLGKINEAVKLFENIISNYPGQDDLINKSQKYIERYK